MHGYMLQPDVRLVAYIFVCLSSNSQSKYERSKYEREQRVQSAMITLNNAVREPFYKSIQPFFVGSKKLLMGISFLPGGPAF